MKKEFIPYEQALELKELGFNEPCFAFWTNSPKYKGDNIQLCVTDGRHGYSPNSISFKQDFLKEGEVLAPLYQQAFRFFREKYEFVGTVLGDGFNGKLKGYYYSITEDGWINYYESIDDQKWYDTYEEAELACLRKLIEIVKTK